MFRNHFFRDLVIGLQDEILDPTTTKDKEELVRCLLSRAYYTAFLYCKKQILKNNPNLTFNYHKNESHNDFINSLKSSNYKVFRLMRELKDERVIADYETLPIVNDRSEVVSSLGNKHKIDIIQTVKNMETILNSVIHYP